MKKGVIYTFTRTHSHPKHTNVPYTHVERNIVCFTPNFKSTPEHTKVPLTHFYAESVCATP
ncbi:MAG: hypothetical protein IIX64_04570 [Bacteroidales bacterium]|nr:hypothetical protein [Bacteroidales bacterium]